MDNLGLWWDTQSDLIYPSPKPDVTSFTAATTKREILKWASTIFDPLGFITPVTIFTKLSLQKLWQQQLGSDTALSEELITMWLKISKLLRLLQYHSLDSVSPCYPHQTQQHYTSLRILAPRHMEQLYVCYTVHILLLLCQSWEQYHSNYTRLELMAAVVASRLCSFVIKLLHNTVTVCLWSDSQMVLSWIYSDKKLKPFVTNRVPTE